MQGNTRGSPSLTCTAWLVAAAVTPFGGFISRPLAIVGAVFVLFAFVIAALECQPR